MAVLGYVPELRSSVTESVLDISRVSSQVCTGQHRPAGQCGALADILVSSSSVGEEHL